MLCIRVKEGSVELEILTKYTETGYSLGNIYILFRPSLTAAVINVYHLDFHTANTAALFYIYLEL